MKIKMFLKRNPWLQLVLAISFLAIVAVGAFWIARMNTEIIPDPDVPFGAAPVLDAGDVLTVRVSAPEVSDLYGYQFRIEYDNTLFTASAPQSLLNGITTIFKKDFDGYVLVGATMIGDTPGYSASNAELCEIELTALSDGALPDIKLSGVSAVSSALEYTEDIGDWTYETTVNE